MRRVGPIRRDLDLHTAFGRIEHWREAGLLRVREHAGNARVLELGLGELGLAVRVVAGDGDEAVVGGHGA